MTGHTRYTMLIHWSDEDQAYLVTLPEWAHTVLQPVTHGDTYIEAARNGQEVLEMLVAEAEDKGEALPSVQTVQLT
jgi:predicted RNase H-like HicB family nuclease